MTRILVSGFEPFGTNALNPSQSLVNYLNSCEPHSDALALTSSDLDVRGVVLPVEFGSAFEKLRAEAQHFRPDVILSFGLAATRLKVEIERVAVNWNGEEADNSGRVVRGPILVGEPFALPTTLPFERIVSALRKLNEFEVGESFSAGTYVCNDLFYRMQVHTQFSHVQSGFIHLPPHLTLDQLKKLAWTSIGVFVKQR